MDNSFKNILSSYGQLVKSGRGKNGFNITVSLLIFFLLMMYLLIHEPGDESLQNNSPRNENRSKTQKTAADHYDKTQSVRGNFPNWERCRVDRCVDGDTIVVLSGNLKEKVRLLGIDTPETVKKSTPIQAFGPEASDYTKKRIEESDRYVYLKVDGDRTDQYGRRLALVYLDEHENNLLNKELVERGLARAELKYHYSTAMKEVFSNAQKKAQTDRLGIWSLPGAMSSPNAVPLHK